MASGVYKITCKENNQEYVGSAIDINKRWIEHRTDLKHDVHHSSYLQNSYNKYGVEKFTYEILEECEPDKLLEREQFWIDELDPQFNMVKTAYSHLGAKRTEETKQRLSEAMKANGSKPPSRLGSHHSDQSRAKMSAAKKGKPAWNKGMKMNRKDNT